MNSPGFPDMYKPRAQAQSRALDIFRDAKDAKVTWTFVSPAIEIAPGERTGRFTLGTDGVVFDADGKSRISAEDYAVAVLDEAETPKHPNRRFTLAYS